MRPILNSVLPLKTWAISLFDCHHVQDFNYLYGGTMEITVEVSCCKFPDKSKLFREWGYNDMAFLSYLEQAQTGIKGSSSAEHL